MTRVEEQRVRRLHAALTTRRATLVSDLAEAEKKFERLKKRAERFDPLAGPDAQAQQLARVGELRAALNEHDAAAVAKLRVRTERA